ncbi:DUF5658 family protein [Ectobacillus antri]|jgi:hypothetical protein|uniref:DUF5658 family protein n=1 Tax=Ectobacillus antri TaxID=2486280 RepID=A0ABT6H519_9BACI|nr:DUF5658 family protein [Ectobacillus antri]MDG4657413.1 DUF5658 family protein [Ectobacillus antri]MDG5754456.1 DUF5658 family protein [Ectobacillus antri]
MRFIFHYLAWLNAADGIVSFVGLQLRLIEEGNLMMRILYEYNPYLFLACKLTLSAILLPFVLYKGYFSSKFLKITACSASFVYTIIFVLHGIWIILALPI